MRLLTLSEDQDDTLQSVSSLGLVFMDATNQLPCSLEFLSVTAIIPVVSRPPTLCPCHLRLNLLDLLCNVHHLGGVSWEMSSLVVDCLSLDSIDHKMGSTLA